MSKASRREFVGILASSAAAAATTVAFGQEPRENLNEPLLRVGRLEQPNGPAHPLDPAIQMARTALDRMQRGIRDYSSTLIKQERIKGELLPTEHMHAEVRNEVVRNGAVVQPFSVYLNFLKPDEIAGRQVIYVKGANKNKLVAREAKGPERFFGWVWLKPEGALAMRGQRYPITDIGIENLLAKLIERGTRDRKNDPRALLTGVRFIEGAKINGRQCTVLEVTHPEKKPWFDFNVARIFMDAQMQVPIRYAAYSWPTKPGGPLVLEEAYTYLNLKVNVDLKGDAFDHKKRTPA